MSQVHFLHRNRRYLNGDFAELPYLAFEDYESQTLGDVALLNGWATAGIVFTYAGGIAYENFETSTLSNNTPPGPDFGWDGAGIVFGLSFSTQPASQVAADGSTVSLSVVVVGGLAPYTYQWQKNGVDLINGGVVSGATTSVLTLSGITSSEYASYTCGVTDSQSILSVSNAAVLTSIVDDWATRVVNNGGAAPSPGTKTALNTFWAGLMTDGIAIKMKAVNCFVPDSLIACITPLYVGLGIDPWTNNGFVSGDVTINGLTGDGSTKFLNTGFNPISFSALGAAWYEYITSTHRAFGALDGSSILCGSGNYSGSSQGFNGSLSNNVISTSTNGNGFYADERTSTTVHKLFSGSSSSAFSQIGSTDTNSFTAYPNLVNFSLALNLNNAAVDNESGTISYQDFHAGLSSTEAQNLFNRVQQLRTDLGGGFR